MLRHLRHPKKTFLAASLLLGPAGLAAAQAPATDSSKVYTFVAKMPVYPGGRGWLVLLADLRREFQAASGVAGCAAPGFPVNVNLLIGPSGVIYAAEFVNNLLPTTPEPAAGARFGVAKTPPGPPLSAACETALTTAVRRLPRLQPGVQNGQRVTVRLTLPLIPKPR